MKLQSALFAALVLLNLIAMALMVRELSRIVAPIQKLAAVRAHPVPRIPQDVAAFEARPTLATWSPVQDDVLNGELQPAITRRLVEVLAYNELPVRLVNSIVADLSSYDITNTFRWMHELNVVAQINPTPDGPAVVRRTARVCWLLLALRANYGTAGIDLTHMDLRLDAPFIGQRMNLSYVDFSRSDLPGGNWNESNLTSSAFDAVHTEGPLSCTNCKFGGRGSVTQARLVGGKWMTSARSKETP